MLINLQDIAKTVGAKNLYEHLDLIIQPGEKIGLIGRNGVGKTTLLGIMAGTDRDYTGQIERRRGLVVVATAQEHARVMDQPVLEYILGELPEYAKLKHDIDRLGESMGDDMGLIEQYSAALFRFGELEYYDIEERVLRELDDFGIDEGKARGTIGMLSGGQKRFVELVKVTLSNADLALIDEPTNHMDYVAKAAFVKWLAGTPLAAMVITHDRDVLQVVDRIIEMRGHDLASFPGNYEAFLRQNGASTSQEIQTYEMGQKRLVKIEKQIREAKSKKASWSGTADKTNPFMLLERRLTKEKEELQDKLRKPDFWIDQETIETMNDKVVARYDKYKTRNIRLGTQGEHRQRDLIKVRDLSLGYGQPLFAGVSFDLAVGERLQLHGRNGVGKSTMIKQLLAVAGGDDPPATTYAGEDKLDKKTVIGIYEQEIDEKYLNLPLGLAVTRVYQDQDIPITDQKVRSILADYLFDTHLDLKLEISRLSGGQKARFQLIKMLCHNPNLLILDEPTNHLDLPSIEELEKALDRYQGAVLYVSHDSYFVRNVGGKVVSIAAIV